MDNRHRIYYLVNLNQNYNRSGWFSKGWDDYGWTYEENLSVLKKSLHSLKITPNNQTDYHNYFQMKISCYKDEEELLLNILTNLKDVNYIKLNI